MTQRVVQPTSTPPAVDTTPREARWFMRPKLLAGTLVLIGLVAYFNSLRAAFVFDDVGRIVQDESIRQLTPLGPLLAKAGTRPMLNLSLAANYALGGLDPVGYHAFNLAIHLLAGLTLFGLVRRTLKLPRLRDTFGAVADPLAFGVALVWLVHPLNTQAVTYVVQRCEAMMALSFLIMLYCVMRGSEGRNGRWWYLAALTALLLGLGSKEVMVTAPVVLLAFDRIFLASSWRELVTRRAWLYVSCGVLLAGFAVVLRPMLVATDATQATGFGQDELTSIEYARTQPAVVLHYLRLVGWPDQLCIDYEWPIAKTPREIYRPLVVVLGIVGLGLWALWKAPPVGFLIVAVFVVLAPTSSIVPIKDLAFEHRMYLPLAAISALAVCGGYWCWKLVERLGDLPTVLSYRFAFAAVVGVVAVALTARTIVRNEDYRTEVAMWQSVLDVRPTNIRANHNLAMKLVADGRDYEAQDRVRRAIEICRERGVPAAELQVLLGEMLTRDQQWKEAAYYLRTAITSMATAPWSDLKRARRQAEAFLSLATVYEFQENNRRAERCFEQAIGLRPDFAPAYAMYGQSLIRSGRPERALQAWKKAAELQPDWFDVHRDIARLQIELGDAEDARKHLWAAYRLRPDDAEIKLALSARQASNSQPPVSIESPE